MVDESFFDYLKSETGIDVDAFTGSVSDLLRRDEHAQKQIVT